MSPTKGQDQSAAFHLSHRLIGGVAVNQKNAAGVLGEVDLGDLMAPRWVEDIYGHLGAADDPEPPALADLTFLGDEHQPAGFIGLMKSRHPAPCDQGLVEPAEQWFQPMQAVGHCARRQIQPQQSPGLEQAFGWPLGSVFVEQDLNPHRHTQSPFRDQFGHARRSDRPGSRTGTGPLISPPPNDSPIDYGFNLYLFRLFGTASGQRETADRADTLRFGYVPQIFANWQMAIIAPFGTRPATPLTAGLWL